jgi:hypothetical protein
LFILLHTTISPLSVDLYLTRALSGLTRACHLVNGQVSSHWSLWICYYFVFMRFPVWISDDTLLLWRILLEISLSVKQVLG